MNLSVLLSTPVFWITIFEVILFSYLAVSIIKNPRKIEIKKEEMNPVLLGFLIIGLGYYFMWSSRSEAILWAFQNHNNLVITTGEIISASAEWRGSRLRNAYGLHFEIWYEYEVDDKVYKSDRVNYGFTGSSDEAFATEYIEKYPIGKTVKVYYDPKNPQKAVLEPEIIEYDGALSLIMIATLGLFFISTGLAQNRA